MLLVSLRLRAVARVPELPLTSAVACCLAGMHGPSCARSDARLIGAFPGALSRSEVETEWKELAATLRNNILSSDRNEIASVVERTRAVCNVIQSALEFPVENLTDAASALETIARPREDADDE